MVCCKLNNPMRRHMALQDTIVALARRAGISCRKEEKAPGDRTRPGDVFFPRWDSDGPLAVDITVRDPRAPSHPLASADGLEKWRDRQEVEKSTLYGATCQRLGWNFAPFVVDVWGGLGPQARKFMGTLVKMIAGEKEGWQRREAEAGVWQELGMALARELGRQLAWHAHAGEVAEEGMASHAPYLE